MARIKQKEHEKLNSENIKRVIALLNPSEGKPITKKDACSILNISYNTTRLGNIISEFEKKEAYVGSMKARNRGKHATKEEIIQAIAEYLRGETVAQIAKGLFRSSGFVKAIIERIGVPQRPTTSEAKYSIDLLPETCISESFEIGEVVWSAKYHSTAVIKSELEDDKYKERYESKCYAISVIEVIDSSDSLFPHIQSGGFNAYALAYDLGSLKHLKEYGSFTSI